MHTPRLTLYTFLGILLRKLRTHGVTSAFDLACMNQKQIRALAREIRLAANGSDAIAKRALAVTRPCQEHSRRHGHVFWVCAINLAI